MEKPPGADPAAATAVLGDELPVMSDDKSKTAPQDASRINVNEDYELRYWTQKLGVTEDRLRQLVKDHGTSADAARKAIG